MVQALVLVAFAAASAKYFSVFLANGKAMMWLFLNALIAMAVVRAHVVSAKV